MTTRPVTEAVIGRAAAVRGCGSRSSLLAGRCSSCWSRRGSRAARSPSISSSSELESAASGRPTSSTASAFTTRSSATSPSAIPAKPDLTARYAQIQMRINVDGSVEVYRIVARGVRLRGAAAAAAARSAGARSTNCCRRRAASRSGCPTSRSISPTRRSRWRRRTAGSASRWRARAISPAASRAGWRRRRAAACAPGACALDGMRANVALARRRAAAARRAGRSPPTQFVCPQQPDGAGRAAARDRQRLQRGVRAVRRPGPARCRTR